MREAASFIAGQSGQNPAGVLSQLFDAGARAWRAWRGRRQVIVLRDLDDHILVDIGVTRADVRWALDLPFMHDASCELERRATRRQESRWESRCF